MANNKKNSPESNVSQEASDESLEQNADGAEEESLGSPIVEDSVVDTKDEDVSADARVAELEAELADLKDRSLRALADAENTRRRAERDVADAKKFGPSALVKDLLNVSDNLHRALDAVSDDVKESDEAVKNLVVGVELVEKEFLAAFEKHGVTKLEPLGEKFDHDYHQAMYEVEDSGQPAGTIVELLQPRYVMHDRLLRPAMVAIAKGAADEPPDDVEHVDTTA
ncbi:MAG TPA: nucleotide exchange factor GrpE [Rhodospirillaceae bacterium]|nr:nucleotide exchange factor GrpE [Rhodospirillaceae bacterium]